MKYCVVCKKCGKTIGSLAEWFGQDQRCSCGSDYAEVRYLGQKKIQFEYIDGDYTDYQHLYYDILPLYDRRNIVSLGEGLVPMERWGHLEDAARSHGVNCEVYVCRNDLNGGSGTFKDISASLAASVLKENGIRDYCLASTGNAGVAFATYLAEAGVRFTEFAPSFIEEDFVRTIERVHQKVVVSKGGYGDAKAEAVRFHDKNHVLISGGNIDPLRIESKRTIVFECLRQLKKLPTVYIQAVAGGTGPLAFEKGFGELEGYGYDNVRFPRMLLVQQDECDPMVTAWEKAKKESFPEGWEHSYEAKTNVNTRIAILTAANPGNYPLLAPLVRRSKGDFLRVNEKELPRYGKEMLGRTGVLLGPASMVCYAGFYKALENNMIHNDDCVLLNTGEGCGKNSWFVKEIENC